MKAALWHEHFMDNRLMNAQLESPEMAVSGIEVERAFDLITEPRDENAPETEITALVPEAVRRDETESARRALHGAIDLRLALGEEHRAAGRIADAIRSFESVLVFDRKNELACSRLEQLRPNVPPTSRLDWLASCFCVQRAARRGGRASRAAPERRAPWAARRREGAAPKLRRRRRGSLKPPPDVLSDGAVLPSKRNAPLLRALRAIGRLITAES
jgi:hypothetical protein